MGFNDVCLILATFLGPIVAVQAQKMVERLSDAKSRRLQLFKTLMATRASLVSPAHVQALNGITLEFEGAKFASIRTAWKVYLDHLHDFPNPPQGQDFDQAAVDAWARTRNDRLTGLLQAMGKKLGYEFDSVDIAKGAYLPVAHEQLEQKQGQLLDTIVKAFSGETPLKMDVVGFPTDEKFKQMYGTTLYRIGTALEGGSLSVKLQTPIVDAAPPANEIGLPAAAPPR